MSIDRAVAVGAVVGVALGIALSATIGIPVGIGVALVFVAGARRRREDGKS